MAIARMLKTEIVCPRQDDSSLLPTIEKSRLIHIEDIHEGLAEEVAGIEQAMPLDATSEDAALQKAKSILDSFNKYDPHKTGLLANFFASPPYIEEHAFRRTLDSFDIQSCAERVFALVARLDTISAELRKSDELETQLLPWTALEETTSSILGMRSVVSIPVLAAPVAVDSLLAGRKNPEDFEWAEVSRDDRRVAGIFIATPDKAEGLDSELKTAGVLRASLPSLDETPQNAIHRLQSERVELQRVQTELEGALIDEAAASRGFVEAVHDDHFNRRRNELARKNLFHSRHVVVIRGWILARDRDRMSTFLAQNIPGSEAVFSAPTKDDHPPVKLENPAILKPFQSLLDLFGLPTYFGIDPTWFVAIAMTLFYSICLGDAAYGVLQILLALWIKRKFKPAEGTRMFLNLLIELGAGTVIFGVLTWTFFGLMPGYTEGGAKILGFLPLIVPTTDILPMLGIAVAIGVVFQLASILLGFYASMKNGDFAAAIYDYLSWFVLLVGVLLWASTKFVSGLPPICAIVSYVLMGASALTILFFAGRDSKGFVGRLVIGLISFYGILGAYGLVSFFSDVLSFLRISVLNLSSSFISFAANIMGQLIMGKGGLLYTIITFIIGMIPVILFHGLNLILSMMGSFIHSMRLNFLESFGRYYKSGGKPFAPFRREGTYYRFEQ